jgi:hypothetical protein
LVTFSLKNAKPKNDLDFPQNCYRATPGTNKRIQMMRMNKSSRF